ncbi:MAG TPA: Hsp20/alpha crystallin family protein [Streptosporangiaceae bacterium]|nr:Hsp20/alpha crystallin family protein [Streptosporangiaceae bacterium]
MLLTSIDPFSQEFDRLTQRVFRTAARAQSLVPMDAVRGEDELVLRFDLPGVDPESIDLTVDRRVLTVSVRRSEELADGASPLTRERVMGSFTRRVYLADTLDSDKIEAAYVDGALTVRLPVAEKARPRKVEIQTGTKKKITA